MKNMNKLILLSLAFFYISIAEAQYYLLPVVKNGQNPANLNRDLENQQGAGLTSGWMTILQGPQPAGNWSSTFSIPFKFYFNGALVKSYKASTSGIVTFNTKTSSRVDSNNIALPTSRVPDSSICIWGIRASMGDYIVIKTFGTAPHRQLWISYNSFSELNIKSGYIFASVVLEETTNKIYIVDQRTQCISNNNPCPDKTSLTLGIQIDSTNAIMVSGSPDYQSDNLNSAGVEDNAYYEFIPGVQPTLDVESQTHLLKDYYLIQEFPISVKAKFKNIGTNDISKVSYNYSVDNGVVKTCDITGLNIAPYQDFELTHTQPWQTSDVSFTIHSIRSWISQINDSPVSNPSDDTLTSMHIVNDTFFTRKLMHETFTSSTSQQAKAGNDTLHSVLNGHPGLFTELNYQMTSFQGGGDPYYTIEAGNRSRYYSIGNTIPTTVLDGSSNISPAGYNSQTFSIYQEVPSFYQIIPSGTVKGQQIDVKIEIKNEEPVAANTRLFVAVCEKATYKNVKTNGETVFPHVMKKFLPDTLGTLVGALPADSNKVFNFSWTVPGNYRLPVDGRTNNIINLLTEHSIEDFSNLEVIAWLQENDKTILQSNSADLKFSVSNQDPILKKEILVFPNPAEDYIYIDMSSFQTQHELKILIADYTGNQIFSDKTSLKSMFINTSTWIPGVYFIRVLGNDEEGYKKIIVLD
jgi:hypothetical protein